MRGFHYLCIAAVGLFACGDNIVPHPVVVTRVAKSSYAAGERINARCAIVDLLGEPVLDAAGEPLTDSTRFEIDYRDSDLFATDAEGAEIAAHTGDAVVRCSAPDVGLFDEEGKQITIVAGPAERVVTKCASNTTTAGVAVGVSCLAFDAFDNPVADVVHSLAISPFGAGSTTTADSVAATIAGEYDVSCVVKGAARVEDDHLVVLPALPSSLIGAIAPERILYAVGDQVTLVPEAHDQFGNRVDDVTYAYSSSPAVPSPSEARFNFDTDGTFMLTATVTSATLNNKPLSVSLPVFVDTGGPAIECRRIDAPAQAEEAYMIQLGQTTAVFPVHVSATFDVQTVTIGGVNAAFNANTGNYEAPLPVSFGMNFVDVVATDKFGKQNSTTCFVEAGEFFTAESTHMGGALGLRLDPNAIGDPVPTGLNSLDDILFAILSSPQLRSLIDAGLVAANPISNGGCGVFACSPRVNYNGNSLSYNQPQTSLSLIPGGLRATVNLPNVHLSVNACGTTCCIGGSTIQVTADFISASVDFSLQLQGGVLRASVAGTPNVTVGSVNLNGSGFCGFIINIIQGFFTGTVKNAVRDALVNFINSDVGPLLDQLVSSLDVNTLGTSFNVPRLDGSGTVQLGFGLALSSFDVTTARALLGIGTRFTATAAQNRPSLGIARRTPNPLLDPPGTTGAKPVGLSFYEGVLNQVLHGLWRGGYFQATLQLGGGTATIDGRLPPVAALTSANHAQLMLGGIAATITIPGVINTPIPILFGGRASASVSLVGDALVFGGFTIDQLFVSFQAPLTQQQRTAMSNFLKTVLQDVLADAINKGLPAVPIPSFALPASAANFGLPAGAELGILSPQLATSGSHLVLTGGFGVRP